MLAAKLMICSCSLILSRRISLLVMESPRSECNLQKLSRMLAVTGFRTISAAQRSAVCAASQCSARPSGAAYLLFCLCRCWCSVL